MTESDDIDTNEIYYKSIYSKKSKTLYKIKPPEKKYNNNTIIKYSYPLCILKNNKKESEEIRKIQQRMVCSKKEEQKEKDIKEKLLYFKLVYKNNNLKRNSSTKFLDIKDKQKLTFQNTIINLNNKKLIRSRSNPIFNNIQQENYFRKKDFLSQIEKRGNYYNKKIIASLQRQALNKISLPIFKNNDVDYFLPKINKCNTIEESAKNKLPEVRQFLNNRITIVNEKKNGDFWNNNENFKKIKKRKKKYTEFDKKQINKDYNKPLEKVIKMTKNKLRDLKVMASINKIRDPDIINKYKALINT